tara:strand:- start:429 stop:662 length:234 start_codon:yes stop_codon:yes gene_type:complete
VKLAKQDRALIAFMGNLIAIVLLSKIGGTGGDLAVMTGLIGVAGMLAQRMGEKVDDEVQRVSVENDRSKPVPTVEEA